MASNVYLQKDRGPRTLREWLELGIVACYAAASMIAGTFAIACVITGIGVYATAHMCAERVRRMAW